MHLTGIQLRRSRSDRSTDIPTLAVTTSQLPLLRRSCCTSGRITLQRHNPQLELENDDERGNPEKTFHRRRRKAFRPCSGRGVARRGVCICAAKSFVRVRRCAGRAGRVTVACRAANPRPAWTVLSRLDGYCSGVIARHYAGHSRCNVLSHDYADGLAAPGVRWQPSGRPGQRQRFLGHPGKPPVAQYVASILIAPTAFTNPGGRTMSQMYIARELWAFMRERKKFWMLPMLVVLVAIGGVLIFAQGSVLAPLIYTIF